MKKLLATSALSSLLILGSAFSALALDPVAPKSERVAGYIRVVSPLPTDTCQLIPIQNKSGGEPACKVDDMISVPIGQYLLKVKMQDGYTWETQVPVEPTEFTKVNVIGYGNLKINSSSEATIDVQGADGKTIKTFSASKIQTLPTGTYHLKIKVGGTQTSTNDVQVYTNATTEIGVGK